MTYYVAVDIGCLECGEDSDVLGIFTTKEAAESTIVAHEEWQKANWHGQHDFRVFEVEHLNIAVPVPENKPQ